jgi:hypothetical protein
MLQKCNWSNRKTSDSHFRFGTQHSEEDANACCTRAGYLNSLGPAAIMRPAATAARRVLQLFYNDYVRLEMPPRHRFPMGKYFQVRSTLQAELAPGSVDGGDGAEDAAVVPSAAAAAATLASFHPSPNATREELCAAHSADYVDRVLRGQLSPDEVRRIGLPVHDAFLLRSTTAVGGTVAAMRAVMAAAPPGEFAVAGHVAGGTHHACVVRCSRVCVKMCATLRCAVAQYLSPCSCCRFPCVCLLDSTATPPQGNSAQTTTTTTTNLANCLIDNDDSRHSQVPGPRRRLLRLQRYRGGRGPRDEGRAVAAAASAPEKNIGGGPRRAPGQRHGGDFCW